VKARTRYHYRAATVAGQVVAGLLDAPSRAGVLDDLRRLGRRLAVGVWARNFATLVGAAVPVDRALSATAAQTADAALAAALRQVRRAVQEGAPLADALGRFPRFFPPFVTAMIAAGETGGSLETVLDQLASHLEESAELRSQLLAALLYPALMAVVGGMGVMILLLFVVPRFAGLLADVGGTLPLSTRALVALSTVVTGAWWLWLPAIAAVAYGVREIGRRPGWRREWHARRLEWPLVGELEVAWTTARFCGTLGMLLRAGTPMLPALRIARATVTNLAVGERLDQAIATVAEGEALATALAGLVSPLALQMLAAGEESGRLEEMCLRVSAAHEAELRRSLRTAVALVEPALIVVFGVLVGFVALAMLQAIYSINATIH
jgi:general secretion pathway protein F